MSQAVSRPGDIALPFSSLRLPAGESVQLECRSPRRRWTLSYVGLLGERALLLSLPQRGQQPLLLPDDTPVTLRFIAGNQACACTSRVIKSQLAPIPLLFLDYPRQLEAVKIRNATRLRTQLLVSVDGGEESGAVGWPVQAICRDLSLTGALLEADDLLGEVGDTLYLTVRLPVGELEQVLLLESEIRNLEAIDTDTEYCVRHGISFQHLDEETQLVLTGFVYQQMLREQQLL